MHATNTAVSSKTKSNSHLESKTCAGSVVEAKAARSLRKTRAKLSAPGGIRVLSHPLVAALRPSFSKMQSANRLLERLYTRVVFLTLRSASRSGYPRDDLEAQQGGLRHLAALGTITRFARDVAPSPKGRDATALSRHRRTTAFRCVHLASMPLTSLEPS